MVTSKPAEVAAFYQQYFDLEITVDLGWFICLRRGDASWEIAISERGHDSVPAAVSAVTESSNLFGFIVPDVDAVAKALTDGGVQLETQPVDEVWGQRHFYVRDPEGTFIDVIQLIEPDPEWIAAMTAAAAQ
ncbi:VOC family protein [Kribbella deserti]|uniref:VOC family protein n=1 Tax=Kribbella deserti TaxID=1926257 RepID=A0ABV6QUB5_9ACTN